MYKKLLLFILYIFVSGCANNIDRVSEGIFEAGSEVSKSYQFFPGSTSYESGLTAYKEENYRLAYEIFLHFAKKNDARAQYSLGYMYLNGKGVKRDYSKALAWSLRSANQGSIGAMFQSGWLYHEGLGVERNYSEASAWFHKAAMQGDAESKWYIGLMHLWGRGYEANKEEALRWFKESCDQSYARACLSYKKFGKPKKPEISFDLIKSLKAECLSLEEKEKLREDMNQPIFSKRDAGLAEKALTTKKNLYAAVSIYMDCIKRSEDKGSCQKEELKHKQALARYNETNEALLSSKAQANAAIKRIRAAYPPCVGKNKY